MAALLRASAFYRVWAFVGVLGEVALNLPFWFRQPLSARQLLSWGMLLASLLLAVHGFLLLRVVGRPAGRIDRTTRLVTVGAYRYIRHPLYASLLLLAWGAWLKSLTVAAMLLALAATAALVATARAEEAENLRKFGAAYAAYRRQTRMFIPFVL